MAGQLLYAHFKGSKDPFNPSEGINRILQEMGFTGQGLAPAQRQTKLAEMAQSIRDFYEDPHTHVVDELALREARNIALSIRGEAVNGNTTLFERLIEMVSCNDPNIRTSAALKRFLTTRATGISMTQRSVQEVMGVQHQHHANFASPMRPLQHQSINYSGGPAPLSCHPDRIFSVLSLRSVPTTVGARTKAHGSLNSSARTTRPNGKKCLLPCALAAASLAQTVVRWTAMTHTTAHSHVA